MLSCPTYAIPKEQQKNHKDRVGRTVHSDYCEYGINVHSGLIRLVNYQGK